MKRTMNEYKASMNEIVPSESFISETEALMKKIRDEQNGKINNKNTDTLPEAGQRIDIRTNSRTIRIKKWTMGLSAAAAVLICAVSLNVYNRANVDTQMTHDAQTEEAESSASAETEVTSAADVPSEETAAVTEAAEEEKETAALTDIAAAEEEIDAQTEDIPDNKTEYPDKKKDNKTEDSSSDFGSEPSEDGIGINAANAIDDAPVTVYEEEDSYDGNEITSYSSDYLIESDLYDEEYFDEEEESDEGYQTPVWVPSFIDDTMEEESVEEEAYDESVPSVPVASTYDESYPSDDTGSYTLDVSFRSAALGADEVYVPDTIVDLDEGEYYISAEAGFDEYDPQTGTFIVSNGATFDESVTDINSSIVDKIVGLIASKDQYHYDAETEMYDYRYKLTICSADESENNAKLFEIIFKNGELVINRYDNGTVSSEKYTITTEEYEELDSFIGSLF